MDEDKRYRLQYMAYSFFMTLDRMKAMPTNKCPKYAEIRKFAERHLKSKTPKTK